MSFEKLQGKKRTYLWNLRELLWILRVLLIAFLYSNGISKSTTACICIIYYGMTICLKLTKIGCEGSPTYYCTVSMEHIGTDQWNTAVNGMKHYEILL